MFDELDQMVRAVWLAELRRIEPAHGAREALLHAAIDRLQGMTDDSVCDLPCRLRSLREGTRAYPIDLFLNRPYLLI